MKLAALVVGVVVAASAISVAVTQRAELREERRQTACAELDAMAGSLLAIGGTDASIDYRKTIHETLTPLIAECVP